MGLYNLCFLAEFAEFSFAAFAGRKLNFERNLGKVGIEKTRNGN